MSKKDKLPVTPAKPRFANTLPIVEDTDEDYMAVAPVLTNAEFKKSRETAVKKQPEKKKK